jgi:2-dehydropantoate 2-reductase
MRFIVYGAGAVGGVLGARLAAANHPVVLIARGAHLAAIQANGLRLLSPESDETHRVHAVADPSEVEWQPDDVVLLAMKSMDTVAALRALSGRARPETTVVCVQNGVANEAAALRLFRAVYGVCVMFPATHLTPGVVAAHSSPVPGMLDIGRYPHGSDETAERIAAAFRAATFQSVPRPDIMRWKYNKLLMNLGNAAQAVCGRVDGLGELTARLRAEGEAVLHAAGIPYVSDEEEAQRRDGVLTVKPIAAAGTAEARRGGGSSWQSLARGSGAIESDYLNGEIVLLGRVHGVATPANELLQALANQHAREGTPPGTLTPAAVLAQLEPAGR